MSKNVSVSNISSYFQTKVLNKAFSKHLACQHADFIDLTHVSHVYPKQHKNENDIFGFN